MFTKSFYVLLAFVFIYCSANIISLPEAATIDLYYANNRLGIKPPH